MDTVWGQMIKSGFELDWHRKYAKWGISGEQSLLAHALNVASVAQDLLARIRPGASARERVDTVLAAFFHDFGKGTDEFQGAVRERSHEAEAYHHLAIEDPTALRTAISDMLTTIGEQADDVRLNDLVQVIRASGAVEDVEHHKALLSGGTSSRWKKDVVWLADRLASMKDVRDRRPIDRRCQRVLEENNLRLEYHAIESVRGLTSWLLHQALEESIQASGFQPLLYFAGGTIYLGPRSATLDLTRASIEDKLAEKLHDFYQKPEIMSRLGQSAFGSWTGTIVKQPNLLFLSNDSVSQFWRYVGNTDSVKQRTERSKIGGKGKLKDKTLDLVEEVKRQIRSLANDDAQAVMAALEARGGVRLLLALKSVVSEIGCDEVKEDLAQEFQGKLGIDLRWDGPDRYHTISWLGNNATVEDIVRLWIPLRQALGNNQTERINRLLDFAEHFTLQHRSKGRERHNFENWLRRASRFLIKEVENPRLCERDLNEARDAYLTGKARGMPSCPRCGGPIQPQFNKSSWSGFYNLLPGGYCSLGPGVCDPCGFEIDLRAVAADRTEQMIFILPQINITRIAAGRWQQIVGALLDGMEQCGLSPLSDPAAVADTVIKKDLDRYAEDLLGPLRDTRGARAVVAGFLKSEFGDQQAEKGHEMDFLKAEITKLAGVRNWKEAAERVMADRTLLGERQSDLEGFLRNNAGLEIYMHPNLICVSSARQIQFEREESETSRQLSEMLIGGLIARSLLATVVFPELPSMPLASTTPGGYVQMKMKPAVRQLMRGRFAGRVTEAAAIMVSVHEIDDALTWLSAVISSADRLRRAEAGYGKDSPFIVARVRRGRVLARYATSRKAGGPQAPFSLELVSSLRQL